MALLMLDFLLHIYFGNIVAVNNGLSVYRMFENVIFVIEVDTNKILFRIVLFLYADDIFPICII